MESSRSYKKIFSKWRNLVSNSSESFRRERLVGWKKSLFSWKPLFIKNNKIVQKVVFCQAWKRHCDFKMFLSNLAFWLLSDFYWHCNTSQDIYKEKTFKATTYNIHDYCQLEEMRICESIYHLISWQGTLFAHFLFYNSSFLLNIT